MTLDPQLQQLLDYEAQVTGFIAQVSQDHLALQELDYDRDLKVLRETLDKWLTWHIGASGWLSLAKQQVRAARYQHRQAWQSAVTRKRGHLDIYNEGSYEERRVRFEIETDAEFRTLDILERVADTVTEFKFLLRTCLDHWNARRSDVKFEWQSELRTPGSDYAHTDAT